MAGNGLSDSSAHCMIEDAGRGDLGGIDHRDFPDQTRPDQQYHADQRAVGELHFCASVLDERDWL